MQESCCQFGLWVCAPVIKVCSGIILKSLRPCSEQGEQEV